MFLGKCKLTYLFNPILLLLLARRNASLLFRLLACCPVVPFRFRFLHIVVPLFRHVLLLLLLVVVTESQIGQVDVALAFVVPAGDATVGAVLRKEKLFRSWLMKNVEGCNVPPH